MTCQEWISYGFIGGDGASGGRCGQDDVEGENVCSRHLSERQYFAAQFASMMERATRHTPGIILHGKGQWCGCGLFVEHGTNHPFGLPHHLEEAQARLGLEPCMDCAYRWSGFHHHVNCGAGCDDGWVPCG